MNKKKTDKKRTTKAPPAQTAGGHTSAQKNTIFVSVVIGFISTFMGSALNLSIPAIEAEFQVSAASVGWIITLYMLTCAALAVPFGRMADGMKRERILRVGILLFTVSSLAAAFAHSMGMLLFCRFVQGTGASMFFSTNMAILVEAFDRSQRGRVLGYSTSATYVGLSAGPVLGGILNHQFGWRSVFLASAVIAAAALYSAFRKLPVPEKKTGFRARPALDGKGSFLYVCGISALMYGLSTVTTTTWGWAILAAGGGLFVWFILTERRAENPVVKLSLFRRNPVYSCSNLAAMVSYAAYFAVSYLLSIYLQVVMGYTSQTAGLLLITAPVVQAVLSPLMGRLSDRFSPYLLSAAGMGVCTASLIFYTFLPEKVSMPVILCALTATGIGFAIFASPNTNAVMTAVRKTDYGIASSLLATMRSIGHTVSMAVITAIVGMYIGTESLKEASPDMLMKTMHSSFLVYTLLCIFAIVMVMRRKP